MALPAILTLSNLSTAQNLLGGASTTLSNSLFGTKGTCSQMPSDEQLAHVIRFAGPSENPMRKIRERFGRSGEGGKYGGTRETAIYRAPISEVGKWFRYDCSSAGPIRQDMAKDFATLWAKYGATFGAVSSPGVVNSDFGSAPADIEPISYDSGGITGGVEYDQDNGGLTGGISFGQPQGTPNWMMMVLGVLVIIAIVAFATGRGGGTTGGMS